MRAASILVLLSLTLVAMLPAHAQDDSRPVVIAHRGASGYLPEHTLEAVAMAHALGADHIEQDVVLTQDDVPIVVHDIVLEAVTNVAEVFPDRARADGHFYAIDFTLAEIKQLKAHERTDMATGEAVFPGRFPLESTVAFEIPTLEEEIVMIQGLNRSTGRQVGIYPELKEPAFHQQEGKDIGPIVLALLAEYGYTKRSDPVFVQCFDPAYTRYLRDELGTDLKLVQLISVRQANLTTPDGLEQVAEYADGIGPSMNFVFSVNSAGEAQITPLVENAHALGLVVHPYTWRADSLPANVQSFEQLLEVTFAGAGVDGVFTDHADLVAAYVSALD